MSNQAPTSLQFGTSKTSYNLGDAVSLSGGWVYDANGASDLQKVDLWLQKDGAAWQDISDVTSFTPWASDNRWGGFNYSLGSLSSGNYTLWGQARDASGASSNSVQTQFSVISNAAPSALYFNLNSTTLNTTDTLSINGGWAYDTNGSSDLSRVDFWLKTAAGGWINVSDATSFSPWTSDNRWGAFNYSLSLSGLGLSSGTHTLWAQAYDRSGAVSSAVERSFFVQGNIAPGALYFNLNSTTLNTTDTLSINGGWAYDTNGSSDLSRVDFWLKTAAGGWINVSDATSFSPWANDNRWGAFNYSLSLSGLGLSSGTHTLWAQAYDRSGAVSSAVERSFFVQGNIAPGALYFNLNSTTLNTTDTLSINGGWAYDTNGSSDLSRVDFWLKTTAGGWINVSDAVGFSPWASDNRWGAFNYSLSLSGLGLSSGTHTLWAQAYDRSGAVSSAVERSFFVQGNIAPSALYFNLNSTTLNTTDTLSINGGWAYDTNGSSDLSRVDFWLKTAAGGWINVSDATSFSPWASDNRWGAFNYSLSLSGLGLSSGTHTLWAQAYDRSGAVSGAVERNFSVQVIGDWFAQNLRDTTLINLTRNLAADGNLSRSDMLAIFRDAQDNTFIDSNEILDLRTLVQNSTRFSMIDSVRWLSDQVANGAFNGMSASQFESTLVGRWFLGNDASLPLAHFTTTIDQQTVTYNLSFTAVQGSLYGSAGRAVIGDIDQGGLGDCSFLAALGATFGRQSSDAGNAISSVINSMITNNNDGTYTFRFFSGGSAQYQTVDTRIATYGSQVFGAKTNGNVLWVALAERAYAQWREWRDGTSGSISGFTRYGNGDTLENPLRYVTGRSTSHVNTWSLTFSQLQTALNSNQAVSAARYVSANSTNVIGSHAYSVTNVYVASNGEQRVVVRNPWGKDGSSTTVPIGDAWDGFLDLSFSSFISQFEGVAFA